MCNPLVSIVIPVYNGANYLREAIDSALRQTYEHVEVIVVNDGSSDGGQTEAIAQSYGDKIRYFSKENGGVASALNLGIKKMRGEWFAWLSHDDFFSDDRIEQDMAVVRNTPDIKVTFCRHKEVDPRGHVLRDANYPIRKVQNARDVFILNGVGLCTMTIHKSCFDRVGLFNESNRTNQDVEMALRLSTVFPFYFSSIPFTYVRIHPERGTVTLVEQHAKDLLALGDFIHADLSLKSFFPNLRSEDGNIAWAWIWMRTMYRSLGAGHYADECYRNAVSAHKGAFHRWAFRLQFAAIEIKKLVKRTIKEKIVARFGFCGR